MDNHNELIFIGNIIHCTKPFTVHTLEKGFLAVKGTKVVGLDNASLLEEFKKKWNFVNATEINLNNSQILIPGLIDTHIHAPQYPNIGLGYDKPLLEWLSSYTYPLEKKYKDIDFAKKIYDAVVNRTLLNGTTTACYFATLYEHTSLTLVDAVITHGQRALVGKVNMIKSAPPDYLETAQHSISSTRKFIKDVLSRKNPLVQPVITPRFAISVDMELMKALGHLAKEFDVHIQTHISENKEEVEQVEKDYGLCYAEVYDEAKLLTEKTILAHGIYLSDEELNLLAARGTSLAHCPASNTCLQSGLFDLRRVNHAGVNVGLGTDVAGGCSLSILDAMKHAITTSVHISYEKDNYDPINCYDAFYLGTLGGAKALAMDDKIGNFETGKEFDALLINMDVENSSVDYLHHCTPLEILQKFIYIGDDRNIQHIYVSGKQIK